MKSINTKLMAFVNAIDTGADFHKGMVIGSLIMNADYMIGLNRKAHKKSHDEALDIIGSQNFDEDRDNAALERHMNWCTEMDQQHKELGAYRDQLKAAYKDLTGNEFKGRTERSKTESKKIIADAKKYFAA